MVNSSNYFAGYKVYESKKIFLWYTYSNLGYHNLRCTCRSYDKAKTLEKLLGCIWLILTLLPILDLRPKGWVLKIEKMRFRKASNFQNHFWHFLETSDQNSIYMNMSKPFLFCFQVQFLQEKSQNLSGK